MRDNIMARMKEFEYLNANKIMNGLGFFIYSIISLICSIALSIYFIKNEVDN
jgi:hypothetical protein